ncbi:MAG: MBL fold metallo-hydrolase [Acidobacteria bacterium]|nr:MAG: MBL fold metallo-hydrolase [Acidobacteriota bacterium]
MTFGDFELLPLIDGYFRLDGGAMFGVVPKPLWERRAPADDRNRIQLATRPLVVRGEKTVTIDAGLGDKMDAKSVDIYAIDRRENMDVAMASAGLAAEDIDVVLASHLHFDHAGGFTIRTADGLRPRFPNARYVVRRGEWEDATHPHERNRASYLAENFVPLEAAGVMDLIDTDRPVVMPGIRVQRTGGHTMHHQIVWIESGGRTAVFAADLIPTVGHVDEPWIMGYDLYPMDTLAFKRAFVREAIDREYLIFFEHDPKIAAGYIREKDGRKYVEPARTHRT